MDIGVHASVGTDTGTTATTPARTSAATGSVFVVAATWDSGQTFVSLTDSKSNTYTEIQSELNASSRRSRMWYVENGAGGANHTVTLTLNGSSGFPALFFIELTGMALSGALDQSQRRGDAATPFTLAAGLTTAEADEILVTFLSAWNGSNPITFGEGGLPSSTIQEEVDSGATWNGALATDIVSSVAAYNPSWTMDNPAASQEQHVWLVTFKAASGAGTVALTGTAGDGCAEADIIAGGQTLIATLTGDTWVAAGAAFEAQRQNLIDGLVSAQGEAAGFNAEVVPNIDVTDVVRTSDTVVTITLPAIPGYEITATETITWTIPSSATLLNAGAIVASPTFVVSAAPEVVIGGETALFESQIVAGGQSFALLLSNDTWVAGGAFDAVRQDIIDGFLSAQSETNGWNAVVLAGLDVTDVVRLSDTVVEVTLPAFASYSITALETITVTVPSAAMTLNVGDIVAGDITVANGAPVTGEPYGADGYVPTTTDPDTAADAEWKHVDDVLDTDYVPTCSDPADASDPEWKQVADLTSADFTPVVDDPDAPVQAEWMDGDERSTDTPALAGFAVLAFGGGSIPTLDEDTEYDIRIEARDQFGEVLTSYTGTVDIASDGNLVTGAGTTAAFTAGVLAAHTIEFGSADTNISISADNGSFVGFSNTFDVASGGGGGGGAPAYNPGNGDTLVHEDDFDSHTSLQQMWDDRGTHGFATTNDPVGGEPESIITPGRGGSGKALRMSYPGGGSQFSCNWNQGDGSAVGDADTIHVFEYWARVTFATTPLADQDTTLGIKWVMIRHPSGDRIQWHMHWMNGSIVCDFSESGAPWTFWQAMDLSQFSDCQGAQPIGPFIEEVADDGEWHHFVHRYRCNSGSGTRDGFAQMWIDGIKVVSVHIDDVGVIPEGAVRDKPYCALDDLDNLAENITSGQITFGSVYTTNTTAFTIDIDDFRRWREAGT